MSWQLRLVISVLVLSCARTSTAQYPTPTQGTFVLKDFQFRSGGRLPELRQHYWTIGTPQRDAQGLVRNAVLIIHGTGGWGGVLIRPEFAGELFRAGGPLDATKYFIILPDAIGHGVEHSQLRSWYIVAKRSLLPEPYLRPSHLVFMEISHGRHSDVEAPAPILRNVEYQKPLATVIGYCARRA